jgi:hypothetical protein
LLQRRRALHHLAGWLPSGKYIVVQGGSSMVNQVGQLCAAIDTVLESSPLTVVAMDTGPIVGGLSFSDAVRRRCAVGAHLLPAQLLAEDIAAVLEGAQAVVSTSLHACITAMSFQVPSVIVNLHNDSDVSALGELTGPTSQLVTDLSHLPAAMHKALGSVSDGQLVAALQGELDLHFDRMASVIEIATRDESVGPARAQRRAAVVAQEIRALRRAHAVRGQQLVAERSALAAAFETEVAHNGRLRERLREVEAELQVATSSHQQQLAEVQHQHQLASLHVVELAAQLEADRAELERVRVSLVTANDDVSASRSQAAVFEQQLRLTESALDAVHRTKTFRLARLPRRIFGRIKG